MPKSSKKGSPRKGRPVPPQGANSDFTLADFADSSSPKSGRMKKGATSVLPLEAKNIDGKASEAAESLAWDEKDISEFDEDIPSQELFADEDKDVTHFPGSPVKKAIRVEVDKGKIYPVDIWFLISRYVAPEDVGRFAAISQGAHAVIHTAQFWLHMYRRFYNESKELPEMLQPNHIEKVHGMRTRVIRSLFYNYPPFTARIQNPRMFENALEIFEGKQCGLMWITRAKGHCHFFFKFRRPKSSPCVMTQKHSGPLARFASDIVHNTEEDCYVLHVIGQHFLSLPAIMGSYLHKTYLSVGHGMRSHKLKMVFTPQLFRCDKAAVAAGTLVVMDPVVNLRMLYWWEPMYPPLHQGSCSSDDAEF